jgi:hypothetical protein
MYKLFKKSGSGPKNGEQYGAPFREEDWEDEANDISPPRESVQNNDRAVGAFAPGLSHQVSSELPLDDMENLLLQITSDRDDNRQLSEVHHEVACFMLTALQVQNPHNILL